MGTAKSGPFPSRGSWSLSLTMMLPSPPRPLPQGCNPEQNFCVDRQYNPSPRKVVTGTDIRQKKGRLYFSLRLRCFFGTCTGTAQKNMSQQMRMRCNPRPPRKTTYLPATLERPQSGKNISSPLFDSDWSSSSHETGRRKREKEKKCRVVAHLLSRYSTWICKTLQK